MWACKVSFIVLSLSSTALSRCLARIGIGRQLLLEGSRHDLSSEDCFVLVYYSHRSLFDGLRRIYLFYINLYNM